jgi:hypothetical protein
MFDLFGINVLLIRAMMRLFANERNEVLQKPTPLHRDIEYIGQHLVEKKKN